MYVNPEEEDSKEIELNNFIFKREEEKKENKNILVLINTDDFKKEPWIPTKSKLIIITIIIITIIMNS